MWVPKLLLLSKKIGFPPRNGQFWPKICIFGHLGPNISLSDLIHLVPCPTKKQCEHLSTLSIFDKYLADLFCFIIVLFVCSIWWLRSVIDLKFVFPRSLQEVEDFARVMPENQIWKISWSYFQEIIPRLEEADFVFRYSWFITRYKHCLCYSPQYWNPFEFRRSHWDRIGFNNSELNLEVKSTVKVHKTNAIVNANQEWYWCQNDCVKKIIRRVAIGSSTKWMPSLRYKTFNIYSLALQVL